MTITAEEVETEGQAAMLRKWGCDQVQGFYYGRPDAEVPESEEATLLSEGRLALAQIATRPGADADQSMP